MKKIKLYMICIAVFIIAIVMPNKVKASYDYYISSYHVDMVVNEYNSYDITETITAYFNVGKHGIIRKIPMINNVKRADASTSKTHAKISNIQVNEKYSKSKSNGYQVIKIGDANKTVRGEQTYIIKYTYDLGNDILKDKDELYFNIVGDEWDTSIEKVSFNITMPKTFDASLLGFSSGRRGTIGSDNLTYNVDGNSIYGSLNKSLSSGEALTIRLELPEGYFIGSSSVDNYYIVLLVLCLVFILIADKLWRTYGKDDPVIETIEFYPPEGYNSAEISYMYKGTVDNKGIISLLIYLADKGYLKIEEFETKGFLSTKKDFKIIKLKDYDGDNEYERIFFNGLFKKYKTVRKATLKEIMQENENAVTIDDMSEEKGKGEFVTSNDLYNKFYITIRRISENMKDNRDNYRMYDKEASSKRKWTALMMIIIYLTIIIKPILLNVGLETFVKSLVFNIFWLGITVYLFLKDGKIIEKVIGFLGTLAGLLLSTFIYGMDLFEIDKFAFVTSMIGIVCILVLLVYTKIMEKRTPFGIEMMGRLRGFKRFLETAEKEQLETLVEKNPEYFYNILPYTYALGISDKWMKKFENIALKEPDWYDSDMDAFDYYRFNSFMHTTMRSVSNSMSSAPSESSGGFSSGGSGGFSGGGSGGGGGSSW